MKVRGISPAEPDSPVNLQFWKGNTIIAFNHAAPGGIMQKCHNNPGDLCLTYLMIEVFSQTNKKLNHLHLFLLEQGRRDSRRFHLSPGSYSVHSQERQILADFTTLTWFSFCSSLRMTSSIRTLRSRLIRTTGRSKLKKRIRLKAQRSRIFRNALILNSHRTRWMSAIWLFTFIKMWLDMVEVSAGNWHINWKGS